MNRYALLVVALLLPAIAYPGVQARQWAETYLPVQPDEQPWNLYRIEGKVPEVLAGKARVEFFERYQGSWFRLARTAVEQSGDFSIRLPANGGLLKVLITPNARSGVVCKDTGNCKAGQPPGDYSTREVPPGIMALIPHPDSGNPVRVNARSHLLARWLLSGPEVSPAAAGLIVDAAEVLSNLLELAGDGETGSEVHTGLMNPDSEYAWLFNEALHALRHHAVDSLMSDWLRPAVLVGQVLDNTGDHDMETTLSGLRANRVLEIDRNGGPARLVEEPSRQRYAEAAFTPLQEDANRSRHDLRIESAAVHEQLEVGLRANAYADLVTADAISALRSLVINASGTPGKPGADEPVMSETGLLRELQFAVEGAFALSVLGLERTDRELSIDLDGSLDINMLAALTGTPLLTAGIQELDVTTANGDRVTMDREGDGLELTLGDRLELRGAIRVEGFGFPELELALDLSHPVEGGPGAAMRSVRNALSGSEAVAGTLSELGISMAGMQGAINIGIPETGLRYALHLEAGELRTAGIEPDHQAPPVRGQDLTDMHGLLKPADHVASGERMAMQ